MPRSRQLARDRIVVIETLKQLDTWYNEASQGRDRPKLLSKLATLELCGLIEGEFDRLALVVQTGRLDDPDWVRENVISKTHGFGYAEHWRPMLSRLIGEIFARRIEEHMELAFPSELEQLKLSLIHI